MWWVVAAAVAVFTTVLRVVFRSPGGVNIAQAPVLHASPRERCLFICVVGSPHSHQRHRVLLARTDRERFLTLPYHLDLSDIIFKAANNINTEPELYWEGGEEGGREGASEVMMSRVDGGVGVVEVVVVGGG